MLTFLPFYDKNFKFRLFRPCCWIHFSHLANLKAFTRLRASIVDLYRHCIRDNVPAEYRRTSSVPRTRADAPEVPGWRRRKAAKKRDRQKSIRYSVQTVSPICIIAWICKFRIVREKSSLKILTKIIAKYDPSRWISISVVSLWFWCRRVLTCNDAKPAMADRGVI